MILKKIFADLHIHIGQDYKQQHVKISASPKLTITSILKEASRYKGIELIGVIDCHSPNVLAEIESLLDAGIAYELTDGGIRFEDVTLLLGSEIEVFDEHSQGPFHVLIYLPTIEKMWHFSEWLMNKMTNVNLSSQRIYCTGRELQAKTKELAGLFIPAHVFTPFKSLYGRGVRNSLTEVLDPAQIDAIELGLSSDSMMADKITELHRYSYVTNSDSHSLSKIGREYQQIKVKDASFKELSLCLQSKENRKITNNYGMNPHLGKYYRTVCQRCFTEVTLGTGSCPACKSSRIIAGVADRIEELGAVNLPSPQRPPYIYQVPLEYIPGLGPKTLGTLLEVFHTEMNIIHQVSLAELAEVTTEKVAQSIINMRESKLNIAAGGGGKYGRVVD